MRKPRPRPRGRNVSHEIVLGSLAWLGGDQRRADIAVTELGADHLGRLVLFDIGYARQRLAQRGAGRRPLAELRPIKCAPTPPPLGRTARSRDVARSHLPALALVGGEQFGAAPARERRCELP